MNIYELSKVEYKKLAKEFQRTFYGKNLFLGCFVVLIFSCIALFYAGFQFGYNNALTDLAICALNIGIILMGFDFIMVMLFNIELRKYIESKKKSKK